MTSPRSIDNGVSSRTARVTLVDDPVDVARNLLNRSKRLGCTEPHHYLLPFRPKKGTYNPDRPQKDWRYALREMLVAANIRVSFYSFRHHAITKLLEHHDVSEETAKAMAGHISEKIIKRYSHVRIEVKRAAVEALERIAPKSVTGTVSSSRKGLLRFPVFSFVSARSGATRFGGTRSVPGSGDIAKEAPDVD